jgi:RNA-directed DNA polymerase
MKRAGNLWEEICDIENIKFAHSQARRGKSFYTEVKMVDANLDLYANLIKDSLINKTFTTSKYDIEERKDGKKIRTIYKLPYYPDRIVQHALLAVIGPILTRSFIRDTFQSIVGRGTSDAMRRVKKFVRSEQCPRYALKIDVEKYYPSVQNHILKDQIRRKIKCSDTLWLIDNIIDSMQGLPIGNYTSQHFNNLYLNSFDWWVKQKLKPSGYFRYCDDILVFGDKSSGLLKTKSQMIDRLSDLHLKVKSNWNIYDVQKNGVDFVGYVFKKDRTKLRPSIAKNFKLACERIKKEVSLANSGECLNSLMAYKGWVMPANAKMLWRAHTNSLIRYFPEQLKGHV